MSLCHINYFKLKTVKAQKSQEETDLVLNHLKEFRKRAHTWNRAITKDVIREYRPSLVGDTLLLLLLLSHFSRVRLCATP